MTSNASQRLFIIKRCFAGLTKAKFSTIYTSIMGRVRIIWLKHYKFINNKYKTDPQTLKLGLRGHKDKICKPSAKSDKLCRNTFSHRFLELIVFVDNWIRYCGIPKKIGASLLWVLSGEDDLSTKYM